MNPKNPISPKVIVGLVAGILFTSLASNFTALNPHVFDFLGPWGLFVFGVLLTAVKALAEYFKTDPLRVLTPTPAELDITAAPKVTVSTPVASTPAVPTGPGTVVQAEAVVPAATSPAAATAAEPTYSNDPAHPVV